MEGRYTPTEIFAHRVKWKPHLAVRKIDDLMKAEIIRAMILCEGNQRLAAAQLGIARDTLRRKLSEYHAEASVESVE